MTREYFLVDCEARGTSPVHGTLTEFGVVRFSGRETFHGRLFRSCPDPDNPAVPKVMERIGTAREVAEDLAAWLGMWPGRPVMVSDNPAFDFMWVAGLFDEAGMLNPFGHSARRISDFWAGLHEDWARTQDWKKLRQTRHDHNPVHDAMGNAEALEAILALADWRKQQHDQ